MNFTFNAFLVHNCTKTWVDVEKYQIDISTDLDALTCEELKEYKVGVTSVCMFENAFVN